MNKSPLQLPLNVLNAWVDIGRSWQKFGLATGRQALETAAGTLNSAARALDLSTRSPERERAETPTAPATDSKVEQTADQP